MNEPQLERVDLNTEFTEDTEDTEDTEKDEERFIAQKPRDAEEYLDCTGRRVRGTNAEEKVGLLRSE